MWLLASVSVSVSVPVPVPVSACVQVAFADFVVFGFSVCLQNAMARAAEFSWSNSAKQYIARFRALF